MKIYFVIVAAVIAAYFIGVKIGCVIGYRRGKSECCEQCQEVFVDVDPEGEL